MSDKIREELEQEVGQEAYDVGYADGVSQTSKSRDEEIEKLYESTISYSNYNDKLGKENAKKDEEIKKLREALEEIVEMYNPSIGFDVSQELVDIAEEALKE